MALTINGSGIAFSDGTTLYQDVPVRLSSGSMSGTITTISGIPTDARVVWLLLNSFQLSSTGLMRMTVSTGSNYASTWTNTSTSAVASTVATAAANWQFFTSNASSYIWNMQFCFVKQDSGTLIMSGTGSTYVTGRLMWSGGRVSYSSFDSISIFNSANNNQTGNWSVLYA